MCPTSRDPNCTSLGPADEDKDSVGVFIAYMITSSALCLLRILTLNDGLKWMYAHLYSG